MVNLARVKQIQERFDRATYLTVYTRGEFGYNDPRKSAQLCFVEFYKMLDSKLYDLFAEAHPTENIVYLVGAEIRILNSAMLSVEDE